MKTSFLWRCSMLLILCLTLYLISISCTNKLLIFPASYFFYPLLKSAQISESFPTNTTPTNLSHLVFGLLGSEKGWRHRRAYIESWWRPNATRGFLFLDKAPSAALLPWPAGLPPYKVSDDLSGILKKSDIRAQRMVHGIMEAVREMGDEEFRWLVMGDDDSIFYVDNIADVVATYDHTKYFYLGGQSEFIMSSYWFSFNQAFGGAGIILSAPLAKALAADMENCLKRYAFLNSADNTTKNCIADIGANLSPQMGNHQIDLRGDISGLLSAHPLSPLLSLHHLDAVEPIFPSKDRFESTRHLMTAAAADQSRMLQQIICHHRERHWSISIAWGYSAQIYETILPRSYLQMPIETFRQWQITPRRPYYRFNTRRRSSGPCKAPHNFFLEAVEKEAKSPEIITTYARSRPRPLASCSLIGSHSANGIHMIKVYSPAAKRNQMDRCECCDIIELDNVMAEIRIRDCMTKEIIA
ncbi:uncharacterized protein LOC131013999 [Salvia miltiorrhiza]|uniref:uncharacterized protein LOC131013999 n=1 Tax=Salvia miltiorrhiza TaxID=226208 RepID=UPI0025ABEB5D|nr:uncharacterized protein LOC131013999 [Salvia miltiorrhiza]